jgi:hypothetical protein
MPKNAETKKLEKSEQVEEIVTKFVCYGKKGLEKDHDIE